MGFILRAKTGLSGVAAKRRVEPVGWYVGWVETDTTTWVFAMNVDVRNARDASARQALTKAVLSRAGVTPRRVCRS